MAYYRLYLLHGPKNEVQGFREFEAKDDIEAVARAESFRQLGPMELWSEHRKVHRWNFIDAVRSTRGNIG